MYTHLFETPAGHLRLYPEVEFLDHEVLLFSIFRGLSVLFSTAAALFYAPSKGAHKGTGSGTSSPELVSLFFDPGRLHKGEVLRIVFLIFTPQAPWLVFLVESFVAVGLQEFRSVGLVSFHSVHCFL